MGKKRKGEKVNNGILDKISDPNRPFQTERLHIYSPLPLEKLLAWHRKLSIVDQCLWSVKLSLYGSGAHLHSRVVWVNMTMKSKFCFGKEKGSVETSAIRTKLVSRSSATTGAGRRKEKPHTNHDVNDHRKPSLLFSGEEVIFK